MAARLTPHQKQTLLRLGRMSVIYRLADGSRAIDEKQVGLSDEPKLLPTKWVLAKDCGQPVALQRLVLKGYAESRIEEGPRGGLHESFRPTALGWEVYDKDAASRCPKCGSDYTVFYAGKHRCPCGHVLEGVSDA